MADPNLNPTPPELVKWFVWALRHFGQEWKTLRTAPLAFVGVGVFGIAVGYFAATAFYQERLSTDDERVKFATEQVNAYKDKLQGASPDEAEKQIKDLSAQLQDLKEQAEDRVLSDEVKSYLHSMLANQSGNAQVKLINSPSPDSIGLAVQIADSLRSSGWNVDFKPGVLDADSVINIFRGSSLEASNEPGTKLEGPARALARALACIGIRPTPQSNMKLSKDQLKLYIGDRAKGERISKSTDDACRSPR